MQGWRVVWKKITALTHRRNQQRAAELAEKLQNTIVFFGDASDQELLAEEHIDQVDLFIAVTNDDEARSCPPCLPNVWVRKR